MVIDLVTYSDADLVQSYIYQTIGGERISLTGWSLRLMVRKHASDPTAMFECNTQNGRIWFNDAAQGEFTLQIPISILVTLAPGSYDQSLIGTEPASLLRRDLWRGALEHAAGPTRWALGTQ